MTFEFGSDEDIKTIGEYLRRKREARELSLEDVASSIKIHARYLAAIEESRDQDLPSPVYKELFLKSYADFLGVSLDELLLRLPELEPQPVAEEADQAGEPTKVTPRTQPNVTPRAQSNVTPVQAPLSEHKRKRGRPFLILFLGLVAIGVGLFGLKYYRDNFMKVEDRVTPPETPPVTATIPADTIAVDSTANVAATPEMMNLLMIGKGECWLEVSIDGDSSFSELLKVPDTLWFAMQDSIYFKLGRANTVEVWCNALPLRLVPPDDGTVRSFTITRQNYLSLVDSARLAP